jgi:D-alanine-D-alanine ligase
VRVLGNEAPKASIVGEIVPGHEFYDYDDKYRDDKAKLVIPRAVSEAVSARSGGSPSTSSASAASRAWRASTSSSSAARIACSSTRSTRCPASRPSRCTRSCGRRTGVPLPALLDELIRLALERRDRRARPLTEPPAELA